MATLSSQNIIWWKLETHTRFPQPRTQQCAGILQVCVRSCWMSMKFSGRMMACGHQLTHKHHCTFIGRRRIKSPMTKFSAICKVPSALITPVSTPTLPDEQITIMLHMYNPRRFNEFDLKWIGLVVAELWSPLGSKIAYFVHGHTHMALMGKWPWGNISTGQDGSNGLDLK